MNGIVNDGFESLPDVVKSAVNTAVLTGSAIVRIQFTEMLATQLLENFPFAEQRDVNKSRVARLAERMRLGLWLPVSEGSIMLGIVNKRVYLFAGQHRLLAVKESGASPCMKLEVTTFDSYNEMVRVYADTTNDNLPCCLRDRLKVLGTSDFLQVPKDDASSATTALLFIASGFSGNTTKNPASMLKSVPTLTDPLVRKWEAQIRGYSFLLEECPGPERSGWRKRSVMSAALILLKYQTEKAVEFFGAAMRNDGLKRDSPAWALHNTMLHTSANGNIEALDLSFRVARCWNAFYEGRPELKVVRGIIAGSEAPIMFLGTPYNGRVLPDPVTVLSIGGNGENGIAGASQNE